MDLTYNATSIDQISFKLTQTHLPSNTHLPSYKTSIDSLAYTNTFVSLHHILYQSQPPSPQPNTPQQSYIQKQSTLKSTCADISALTPLKQTQKISFRQRVVTTARNSDKTPMKRRLSLHVMSIDNSLISNKVTETPLHAPHPAPFRAIQMRRKSISGRELSNHKKLMQLQVLQLPNSMRVRGLVLQNHTERQKSFMRRIMQNRSKVVHITESIKHEPQIWTALHRSRKQSQIFC